MYNVDDTICAIATSLTPSGIGIIRISGNEAINIVSKVFVNSKKEKINISESHKVKYGYIYDKKNDTFIDEVLVIPFFTPHSYTAENVVEIQSHGNAMVLKKILNLINENGARLAEPGEFTKRAFLNGRIDLSKAESVADIISSKNEYALKASFNQLKGNLSDKINVFRNVLLEKTAYIEACLDDPEHMSLYCYKEGLKKEIENIIKELDVIIKNYDNGKIIKEGINTVILGKPNVGKSSLLNTLLNEDRAIVTDIAGTTRDTIKESININGITLNIIDTAGIRNEQNIDTVEKIGIDKAKSEAGAADLIILVIDSSKPLDENDYDLISLCKSLNKKTITLLNKIDLIEEKLCEPSNNNKLPSFDGELCSHKGELQEPVINFSTKTKYGLSTLISSIEQMFINNNLDFNNEIFISNERQLSLIKKAKNSLLNVISSIDNKMPEDLLTIDLTDAYTYLSQVLGIEINDDLVNEIFSKFCMGK